MAHLARTSPSAPFSPSSLPLPANWLLVGVSSERGHAWNGCSLFDSMNMPKKPLLNHQGLPLYQVEATKTEEKTTANAYNAKEVPKAGRTKDVKKTQGGG